MRAGGSHERTESTCTTCGDSFSFWRRKRPEEETVCDRCLKRQRDSLSHAKHKDKRNARNRVYGRSYYEANKAKINKQVAALNRARRLADPKAYNAKKAAVYAALRDAVIAKLGGRCACGFDDARALEIEHVGGGGTAHMRSVQRETWYRQILRDTSQVAVKLLCATCNWLEWLSRKPARVEPVYPSSPTALRTQVVAHLGGRCECGETRVEVLHVDHVKGGGSVERRETPRGRYYRQMLTAAPGTFQLRCPNCNAIKKRTNPAEKPGPRAVDSAAQ
jgi:hypothetical protein